MDFLDVLTESKTQLRLFALNRTLRFVGQTNFHQQFHQKVVQLQLHPQHHQQHLQRLQLQQARILTEEIISIH